VPSAPYSDLPVLLPTAPLFLLSGPAVPAEPGSGVHWSLQSPSPVYGRAEKILLNMLGVFQNETRERESKGRGERIRTRWKELEM
jgi:hypothetical protein